MEVRQLRYFVTVAQELHFGRAARRLGIVQPAVSQQISRLERELGVRLLERTPRRVALTGDGARLLTEARAALAAVDRVRALAEDLSAGRAGRLRLGTSPLLGHRLRRGVAALRERAPDLELRLVDGSAVEHGAAVAAGELDAALVRGPVRVPGVRAVALWAEPVSAVLPADHPAADRPAVSPAALAGLALRLPARFDDPALHDAVLRRCAADGVPARPGREVTSVEDAAVEIGAGSRAWTAVYGDRPDLASCAVAVRPFAPPLEVPGQLLVPAGAGAECQRALVSAFRSPGSAARARPRQARQQS